MHLLPRSWRPETGEPRYRDGTSLERGAGVTLDAQRDAGVTLGGY